MKEMDESTDLLFKYLNQHINSWIQEYENVLVYGAGGVANDFLFLIYGTAAFKNLKNKLHAYLFLNCVVMIVNNIGYLLQLVSKTEDAYIAALKFSYAGRVWILFSLFMFSAELCHVALPQFIINGFIIFDIAVETSMPDAETPSTIFLIECKDWQAKVQEIQFEN